MANVNTTISFTLINSLGNPVKGAAFQLIVAGNVCNAISNAQGIVNVTTTLSNITIGTVVVVAAGYTTLNTSYSISPGSNSNSILLAFDPSQINKTVQFYDTSNSPVPNVLVSVNGSIVGRTDSNGIISVITNSGNITIQGNLSGYLPFVLQGNYNGSTLPNRVVMSFVALYSQKITLQTTPGATVNISGFSLTDTIVISQTGFAESNIAFAPGLYTVSISNTNYITANTSLNVISGVSSYALPLLQYTLPTNPLPIPQQSVSSLGTASLTAPVNVESYAVKYKTSPLASASTDTPNATASTSSAINVGSTSEASYPEEWVYPNSADGKYLTGTQARIYIGNLFIDEIDTLYYVYNNNRIPIYGYSSSNVDAFGQGRRIVQGQMSLNYVSQGYLYTALNEYSKASAATSTDANTTAVNNLAALYTQLQTLLAQPPSSSNSAAINTLSGQITTAHSTLGASSIQQVKQILANSNSLKATSNAIIKNVSFDIVISATGGGRTITKKLRNCLLTSNEQVWDQSDNVIKDVYGFVGVSMD